MEKVLMKGNEAIGAAAIKAGCRYFFGYPITPQNEVPEYMAKELPKHGGVFLQAESEVAAINMVYGAAGAGARVMTSSSSPGLALKQEGLTYIAACELPCLVVNVVRGGPGLGGIQPAQSDYYQATRGGGNGDYKLIVLAPASLQELTDMVQEAFDLADYYRNPVMVLADGMIGQMMEPVAFGEIPQWTLPEKNWATTGTDGDRAPNVINSLFLAPEELEALNIRLQAKYQTIKANETRCEIYQLEDAEIVFTAYGTTARIVKNAIKILKAEGIKAGLIRPMTLWPFPEAAYQALPKTVKCILSVEMSCGQMVDDVRLAVESKVPVAFYGRSGGMIPTVDDIVAEAKQLLGR
ncbi:3-methyl-2-oxobutanoate dehydrogenase subunit VorB [Fusibacter paucivorans]|uniref:3-methyl-2-oxobutanoate dehydrogenase subunit VorB n=1 Tax=Fusibacter paucivorans TaxID=76009 RepID=A0ABS5PLZ9_9FIRM|nr:3-methyl-2-oxobutanoate dehydrogenase subunit VorB [Fusibacter paucivorans]MBS7526076.1 3-methyl-2-oxobutanoate dehydrogenase subunit VorB [Fusibacter paucivorans]